MKNDEQFQKEIELLRSFLRQESDFHLVDQRIRELISEGWTQNELVLLVHQVWEQDDSPADNYTVIVLDRLTGFHSPGRGFFD